MATSTVLCKVSVKIRFFKFLCSGRLLLLLEIASAHLRRQIDSTLCPSNCGMYNDIDTFNQQNQTIFHCNHWLAPKRNKEIIIITARIRRMTGGHVFTITLSQVQTRGYPIPDLDGAYPIPSPDGGGGTPSC